jgi:hypothetical protein
VIAKAVFGATAAKSRFVRISDIRPRILLRQAMNGRFGEAASRRWHTLDRRLWADHVDTAAFASRKARRAAAKQL